VSQVLQETTEREHVSSVV